MKQISYRFEFLAPEGTLPVQNSRPTQQNHSRYRKYLSAIQRLRGRSYLQDGAIRPSDLDASGRYLMPCDEKCWHLALLDEQGEAIGCARYHLIQPHGATVGNLLVSKCPLAKDPIWGKKLRAVLQNTLEMTRREGIGYAELGGWAVSPEYRNTKAALEIVLSSYLWAEMIGHCICSCTATTRHNSASILKRIGATRLMHFAEQLPAYFDHHYGCILQLLAFDSRDIPKRFANLLNEMRPKIMGANIIQPS